MDEESTLKEVGLLVSQGWEVIGNCWTKDGRHEFRLRLNGTERSFPVDKPLVWVPPIQIQLGLPF